MEHILETPEFLRTLATLSEETGRPVNELAEEARADLKGDGGQTRRCDCHRLGQVHQVALPGLHRGLHPEEVEQLKELNKTAGLIFLPNHRSTSIRWCCAGRWISTASSEQHPGRGEPGPVADVGDRPPQRHRVHPPGVPRRPFVPGGPEDLLGASDEQ